MTSLRWEKVRAGWYEATDAEQTTWRVVQSGSHEWEIIEPGVGCVLPAAVTLAEAKLSVEDEVAERLDPALRERRDATRAKAIRRRHRRAGAN